MIDVKEMTNEDGIVILTLNGELKIVSAEDSKTKINNVMTLGVVILIGPVAKARVHASLH